MIRIDAARKVEVPPPTLVWALNESSGTTATDSSGNGFNGTWSATPERDTGWARVQGPASRVITRALTGLPTGTSARTLCVWASSWAIGNGEIVGLGNNSGAGVRFGLYKNQDMIYAEGAGVSRGGSHSDWSGLHLYCGSSAAGGSIADVRVYVDGQRVDNSQDGSGTINVTAGEFAVGRIPSVSTVGGADARIHGVLLWSAELTAEQIAAVYAVGPP